jgi:hypothetical protein
LFARVADDVFLLIYLPVFCSESPAVIWLKKFTPSRKAKKPAKLLALRCYDTKPKPSRKAYDIFLPRMPSPFCFFYIREMSYHPFLMCNTTLIRRASLLRVVELVTDVMP